MRPGRAAGVVHTARATDRVHRCVAPISTDGGSSDSAALADMPYAVVNVPAVGGALEKPVNAAFIACAPALWKLVPWAPREAVTEFETRRWWACLPQLPVLPAPTRRRTVAKSIAETPRLGRPLRMGCERSHAGRSASHQGKG